MITKLNQYESNVIDNQIETEEVNGFYYGRKMMILESNWEPTNVFNTISVYPFLSNIASVNGHQFDVKIGYRHFDTIRGLKFYTQYPDGMIWNDENCWGTSVFYISSHGNTKSLLPTLDIIRSDTLFDSLTGFENYSNIIFFGGCGIFNGKQGDDFGYDLLGSSKTRGIFGWKSEVGLLDSMITSQIFLSRFYSIETGSPYDRLPEIYESVLADYKPARVGFTMYV